MPDPSFQNHPQLSLIELQSVDSTNNYARRMIKEGTARHGMTISARKQLQGKGQRGKNWLSNPDENIILSLVLDPQPLTVSDQFYLIALTAVTVHDFFLKYAGDDTKIKWPNDLYWQDRKAGGILIENIISVPGEKEKMSSIQDIWKWAIIGIGININQTAFENLPNPVSLKQITGKKFDIPALVIELSQLLWKNFSSLQTGNKTPGYFFEKYNTHLYKKGNQVKFRKGNRVFEGTVSGTTESGKLIINHAFEEEIEFGEIEWLP